MLSAFMPGEALSGAPGDNFSKVPICRAERRGSGHECRAQGGEVRLRTRTQGSGRIGEAQGTNSGLRAER